MTFSGKDNLKNLREARKLQEILIKYFLYVLKKPWRLKNIKNNKP
ncbi:hypothetical protein CP03DC35_0379 [Chlamydia psittaci 03DC35]|nr:hypothetical protein CP03DC35_0379 [Chlamydia psittaci 03DC35]EPJ99912.1 hypothetical protein CP02DC14_0397 [Chlamydia psittaci 02DC14]